MHTSDTLHLPTFLSGSTLKIIAILSMLIDHIGAGFLTFYINNFKPIGISDPAVYAQYSEQLDRLILLYQIMRGIGRLAFPIFCFLLVQGFLHTHDLKRYLLRLGLFCLVSELPFDLAFHHRLFYPKAQNVFFTLLIAMLVITAFSYARKQFPMGSIRSVILCGSALFLGCGTAYLLQTDYSYIGVLVVVILYLLSDQPFLGTLLACVLLYVTNELEVYALCIPFLILFYNGKRGLSMKYFFYAFYPVHLTLIYLCCILFV